MTGNRHVALLLALVLSLAACSVHRLDDGQVAAGSSSRTAPGRSTSVPGRTADAGPGQDVLGPNGADERPGSSGSGAGPASAPAPGTAIGSPGEAPSRPPVTEAPTGAGGARIASDRGVSEDEIQLGILHTSDEFFAAGGGSTKSVEEVIAPFIAEINDSGGINGRTVVPRISKYNPLVAEEMNAACVEQAEDFEVFSSIAQQGFYGDAEVCMATKETPLLTNNNSSAYTQYERERGWVRQTNQNKDRNSKNWIDWMVSSQTITPATKLGLIYVDVPEDRQLVEDVVLPYLESKGMQPPVIATLSASIAQTPSEAQSAVLRFSAENVEMVLPYVSFLRILIFAQQAESFNYRPDYSVSDFGLLSTDAMAGMPPAQWDGVRGVTVLPTGVAAPGEFPTTQAWADCYAVYKEYGQDIARDSDGKIDGVEVAMVLHYCEHLALWADVARRAGVNPTRRSFLEAFGQTGTWSHRVGLSERLTFSPTKYDGADLYAVVQWQAACTSDGGCYRQIEGFRPGNW